MDYKIIADGCCDIATELRERPGSITMSINVNDSQHSDFLQKFENVLLKTLDIQMAKAVTNGL